MLGRIRTVPFLVGLRSRKVVTDRISPNVVTCEPSICLFLRFLLKVDLGESTGEMQIFIRGLIL